MPNDVYYCLQVIGVEDVPKDLLDQALYVEVEHNKVARKTGTLNVEGKPGWGDTVTFFRPDGDTGRIDVRLRKSARVISLASIDGKDLLAGGEFRRNLLVPKNASHLRMPSKYCGGVKLLLKFVDMHTQATMELDSAEQSVKRLNALMQRSDTAAEVIGALIDVADMVVKIIDNVAKIHPVIKVAWQITSSMYKATARQFHADSQLVELVCKMQDAYKFYNEARNLNDKTQLLKPRVKALVKETVECSRFVQKYAARRFLNRMVHVLDGQEVEAYSTRFDVLRRELDSAIGLNTAQMADAIHEQQQLGLRVGLETNSSVIDISFRQQLDELRKILGPFQFASDVSERVRCFDGTRKEYLTCIMDFLLSETTPTILWLSGVAGSGKSTLAVTASDRCTKAGIQSIHLFFERGKSKPSAIIRTIAYMIADRYPLVAPRIIEAANKNKNINDSTLRDQFKQLLLDPLRAAANSIIGPIVIILDALDESGGVGERLHFLSLLKSDFADLPSKVRILLTSRPEGDIECLSAQSHVRHIVLDHASYDCRRDVSTYIRSRMEVFKNVVKDWDEKVQVLCDAADGLFIWASTAVKMVHGSVHDAVHGSVNRRKRKFQMLVDDVRSVGGGIDSLYETALKESEIWEDESELKDSGTMILGLILVSKEAIAEGTIAGILGLDEDVVDDVLRQIRSVVSFNSEKTVRLHHSSFTDYLLSERSDYMPWHIDETWFRRSLTERCFDIMKDELQFNICGIETSFVPNTEISGLKERIEKRISSQLNYACRFWSAHLCDLEWSDTRIKMRRELRIFATSILLCWLEVLSLTGSFIRVAARALYDASSWISADAEISSFLWSAYKLVSVFAYPISQSVPHIYLSAISLWKGEAPIADHYWNEHPTITVRILGRRGPAHCIKALKGVGALVKSIAISSDGRLVASSSRDNKIRVWDTDSGELIWSDLVEDDTEAVAFSPDNKYIVSCSQGGNAYILEVVRGMLLPDPLTRHTTSFSRDAFMSSTGYTPSITSFKPSRRSRNANMSSARSSPFTPRSFRRETSEAFGPPTEYSADYLSRDASVAYSSDGKRVITVFEGKIYVFSSVKGALVFHASSRFHKDSRITWHVVSLDGKFVVGAMDHDLTDRKDEPCFYYGVWSADTEELVYQPFKSKLELDPLALSADGRCVVARSKDGLCIWTVVNDKFFVRAINRRSVVSVAISSDGKRVASGSADGKIVVLDAESGELIWGPIEGHSKAVTFVMFSPPDERRVISASVDGAILVWDVGGGFADPCVSETHTRAIRAVSFSRCGKHIVSGSEDKTVRIWDVDSGKQLPRTFKGHTRSVRSVSFSLNGKHVVSGSSDGTIGIWDVDNDKLALGLLKGAHRARIFSVAFSFDGRRIVSGSGDKTICIWKSSSGELVTGPLRAHKKEVYSVSFSRDGKRVVSGSGNSSIRIWNATNGKHIRVMTYGSGDRVLSVAFSPDGELVASGSGDNMVRIWNADTGECISGPLRGHEHCVSSVSFSHGGRRVVSGSWDNSVRVWSVDNGELIIGPLVGHVGPVNSVSCSSDGNYVVSGSHDKTIRVWDVRIDSSTPELGEGCHELSKSPTACSSSGTHTCGQMADPAPCRACAFSDFSNWVLYKDGWIRSERGELLIWIPEELRASLWTPQTAAILSCKYSTKLDFMGAPLGRNWTKGYDYTVPDFLR